MKKYDTNKNGKLEEDQIKQLLTDLDDRSPAGTAPDEDEFKFIIQAADDKGDGCLAMGEVEYAVRAWTVYIQKREKMEAKMKEFDKSGSGTLTKDELREYMKDINGGTPVDEAEVTWVMQEADLFGDGEIHKVELVKATALWYAHVKEKQKSSAC